MRSDYICPKCKAEIVFGEKLCAHCSTPFSWHQFKPPIELTPTHNHQNQVPLNYQQSASPYYQKQHCSSQKEDKKQQQKKRGLLPRLIVLSCFVGLIIVCGIIWALLRDGLTHSSTLPQSIFSAAKTTTPFPSAIIITAAQLYKEYHADQEAANAKYRDKIINVTGVVTEIGINRVDTPYVILTGGGQYEFLGVQCLFIAQDKSKLAQLSEGQSLTIEGICQGYSFDVILKNCAIK